MGSGKIEMKMVNDRNSRQVTFSKRRTGLFKKANELAILYAAQIAIIVFSPGGKAFSFGNPTVHSIADCFLNKDDRQDKGSKVLRRARNTQKEIRVRKLNDLLKQVQDQEKIGEILDKALKAYNHKTVAELDFDELVTMKTKLEQLRDGLKGHVTRVGCVFVVAAPFNKPDDQKNDED